MESISALHGASLQWNGWLVEAEGINAQDVCVRFSRPEEHQRKSYRADSYIGYLYPHEEFLLVATNMRLMRFDKKAQLVWQSREIGIDGVLISKIINGVIYGEGEWDPPGGWRPFKVHLESGGPGAST
jgi:hypothetical protein